MPGFYYTNYACVVWEIDKRQGVAAVLHTLNSATRGVFNLNQGRIQPQPGVFSLNQAYSASTRGVFILDQGRILVANVRFEKLNKSRRGQPFSHPKTPVPCSRSRQNSVSLFPGRTYCCPLWLSRCYNPSWCTTPPISVSGWNSTALNGDAVRRIWTEGREVSLTRAGVELPHDIDIAGYVWLVLTILL
jgi:hypothetical protein